MFIQKYMKKIVNLLTFEKNDIKLPNILKKT